MADLTPTAVDKSSVGVITTVNVAPPNPPVPTKPHQADPRFLDPLIIQEMDGPDAGRNFKVINGFNYHTDVWNIQMAGYPFQIIHIPDGFLTDFASVPRLFWNILPPNGMYGKAAVVHDFLYRTPHIATKDEADSVFLEAMQALGVGYIVRHLMYLAVRYFGHFAYKGGL